VLGELLLTVVGRPANSTGGSMLPKATASGVMIVLLVKNGRP
jgi:hypothetical protein